MLDFENVLFIVERNMETATDAISSGCRALNESGRIWVFLGTTSRIQTLLVKVQSPN